MILNPGPNLCIFCNPPSVFTCLYTVISITNHRNILATRDDMELILLPLIVQSAFVSASPGDRSYFYQNCLKDCGESKCEERDLVFPSYSSPFSPLPCALKCKSDCISEANEQIQGKYKITVQFHGKWPFRRLGTATLHMSIHVYSCIICRMLISICEIIWRMLISICEIFDENFEKL